MQRKRAGLQRREALLDAALRCFARAGVLGVGIEEIRRAAGASPSSMYHFFSGLNDLMLALLVRTFERLLGHIATRVARARTARTSVLALVDAHLEWVLEHPEQSRFMYQAVALEFTAAGAAALQRRKGELLAPIVAHLAPFVRSGALPDWSALMFDVVLLGPSHEAARRFLAGAPLDPAWMRRELPVRAWSCLAGSRGAPRQPRDRRAAAEPPLSRRRS